MAEADELNLNDWLTQFTEDQIEEWAGEKLDGITPAHVRALDIAGWQIVRKHNAKWLWPYDGKGTTTDIERELSKDQLMELRLDINEEHAIALDILGWKIVRKDNPDSALWPFACDFTGGPCPDWCQDVT